MTREELASIAQEEIKNNKCLVFQLSTGVGKTKMAIDAINTICDDSFSILIVVAQIVHKQTWQDEIAKWGGIKTNNITLVTYASLHKHKDANYDIIILDESQHLSPRRIEILNSIKVNHNVLCLSATLPKSILTWLKCHYKTSVIKCDITDAIDSNILPAPMIYLVPLHLTNNLTETLIINGDKGLPIVHGNVFQYWHYKKRKDVEAHIKCTPIQYYKRISSEIEYWKNRAMRSSVMWIKNKWLRVCNDRLIWLANQKDDILLTLLDQLKNYRTLTFCNSIEQSEILGKNCIHSKNKLSTELLDKFNAKKIKHITAVNVLNEGVNLSDCRIGIFANINASEIIVKQRQGE